MTNIFITGGTGFIGRHLVSKLIDNGHSVQVLSRHKPAGTGHELIRHVVGNLLNIEQFKHALSGIEVVYHLAVTTIPGDSNQKIKYDAQTNILGSLNLLQEAAKAGVQRFIFVSSGGSVYGVVDPKPVAETHPTNPISGHVF